VKRAWRHVAVGASALIVGCGLDTTGDVPTGLDATMPQGASDSGTIVQAKPDARHGGKGGADATRDARLSHPETGTRADAGGESDAKASSDAVGAHDSAVGDARHDTAAVDAAHHDAASHHDAAADAGGHDAGHHDAARADAGVDASPPPSSCGFPSYSYGCGSASCGCNQTCDDGVKCGACLPHFGTCALDLHDCDTDFSSATSCGGCGNFCCVGLGTCSESGGVYSCDPC